MGRTFGDDGQNVAASITDYVVLGKPLTGSRHPPETVNVVENEPVVAYDAWYSCRMGVRMTAWLLYIALGEFAGVPAGLLGIKQGHFPIDPSQQSPSLPVTAVLGEPAAHPPHKNYNPPTA
jgi:hypothetical protein